jgi:hypothetical protein
MRESRAKSEASLDARKAKATIERKLAGKIKTDIFLQNEWPIGSGSTANS